MPYIGFSKSVNAYEAEQRGEMPLSAWDKAALVLSIVAAYGSEAAEKAEKMTVRELREAFLNRTGWHHTGSKYRRTDYYAFDDGLDGESLKQALTHTPTVRKPKAEKKTVWALVVYTRWEANRYGKRKPHRYQAIATWTESGSETSIATAYYEDRGNGFGYWSEKKRVSSFDYVERLPGKPRKNAKIWREVGEKKDWYR